MKYAIHNDNCWSLLFTLDSLKVQNIINHPVHIKDEKGSMMPSAFIPFCTIGSDILGDKMNRFSQPVCTLFKPQILKGQMCYQMDLKDVANVSLSKWEEKGLIFLMDYNDDKTINEPSMELIQDKLDDITQNDEAMIYFDTLGRKYMIIKSLPRIGNHPYQPPPTTTTTTTTHSSSYF